MYFHTIGLYLLPCLHHSAGEIGDLFCLGDEANTCITMLGLTMKLSTFIE